jgi:hypothetical protein
MENTFKSDEIYDSSMSYSTFKTAKWRHVSMEEINLLKAAKLG